MQLYNLMLRPAFASLIFYGSQNLSITRLQCSVSQMQGQNVKRIMKHVQ